MGSEGRFARFFVARLFIVHNWRVPQKRAGRRAAVATRFADVLARVPSVERPQTLNDERTIAALAEGLEPRLVDWALSIAKVAAEHTYNDIAPSRIEVLAADTARSIEAISINLIRYLLGGRETAAAVRVSRAQREVTIDAVGVGIPLERIIGGLRALDHHWKRTFIELVLETVEREELAEVLSRLDRALSTYFDALVDDNARSWSEENQRLLDQRAFGQRQLLDRIIAGKRVDDELVAEVLGVAPGDEHVGLIIGAAGASDGRGVPLDFASYRAGLERRFPSHAVTFLPADSDTVWAFVSGTPIAERVIAERLAAIGDDVPGAIVSIGLPSPGTAGLRETHATAAAAHAFNRLAPRVGPIVSFSERGLLALVAQSPELARWFVDHEIGPLLERGPLTDELHKTLQTLIGFNGSLVRTAEALYVHRNTITYRLKRIEEILGRDPLARPVETHTALLLAELL